MSTAQRYAKGLDCAEEWIREAQDLNDAQKDELLGLLRGVRCYAGGGEPIWIVGMLRAMNERKVA